MSHDSTKLKMKKTTIITPTFEILFFYFYKKMNILKYIKIQEANNKPKKKKKKKSYHEYDISMTGDPHL